MRRDRSRAGTIIAIIAVAGLVACALAAIGVEAIVSRASCSAHPVEINVAASGDIAPAIRHVGQYFNAQQNMVDGHCAQVHVISEASATVAAQVSGLKSAMKSPGFDAWIPDSSLWVDVARSSPVGAQLVQPAGFSVARSPLMIVMPRSVAAQTPAFGASVGWQFLLPQSVGGPATALGLHVEFPDPAQSSAGLATLIQLQQLLGSGAGARAGFADFVFNVQVTPGTGTASSLASLVSLAEPPRDGRPVTVDSEQAVAQYDRAHPDQLLSGRYPQQGSYDLDYPYVLTTTDPAKVKAAADFENTLKSRYATSYVSYEGFRSAGGAAPGWIGQYGLNTGQPVLAVTAAPGMAESILQAWQRLSLGSRDLVLLDVSKQMATRVSAGGPTLEQVLARAASLGLAQFPNSTQMGIWAFASHLNGNLSYRDLVPVGPLLGPLGLITRRQQIEQVSGSGQPVPGAPAALYSTILAGYKQMTDTYQPRYSNALLVMTAGIDNTPGDMSASQLVSQLRMLYNPRRRIQILPLMLGTAGNFSALQQVATATGGQAFDLTTPSQITAVFFSAIARRICLPNCGT